MSLHRSALRTGVGGAIAVALGVAQTASGQVTEEPAGFRVIVDYSLGFDIDTNRELDDPSPGTYSALVNGFDFAILSNTRTQSLALTFGTDLRLESDPGNDESDPNLDWTDPAFNLNYTRQSANSRLGASARLRQQDVDDVQPFFIDLNGDTIIDETGFEASQGTLTELGGSVTLETGIDAPIGTTYSASYSSRTYQDVVDPELYDRVEYRLATSTRLRFSEVSVGRINAAATQYEYSEGRELDGETLSLSVGLAHQVSPILAFDVSAGYSKSREEELLNDETVTDVEQGPNFAAQLTREVDDGSYFASLTRNLVEDVFRTNLSFGRNLSMRGYDLRAEFGATALDGGEASPTFGLVFSRPLPDGQFSAALSRTVTLNTDDEERELTSAAINYSWQINDRSSVNFGFDYSLVTNPGGEETDSDQTRTTFIASYSHALTREWDLSVGYRGRSRTQGDEDAFSNAVFMDIGRSLIFRP